MMRHSLAFVTSNRGKIKIARRYLEPLNILVQPVRLELTEIQSESIVDIANFKARQAFASIRRPLLVSDHGWFIEALNGFPGPYMKYINRWFTSDDLLNLMKGHKNRSVIMREVLCYIDSTRIKCFVHDIKGLVLEEKRGDGLPAMRVITLSPTNESMAECIRRGVDPPGIQCVWEDFANWYRNKP